MSPVSILLNHVYLHVSLGKLLLQHLKELLSFVAQLTNQTLWFKIKGEKFGCFKVYQGTIVGLVRFGEKWMKLKATNKT